MKPNPPGKEDPDEQQVDEAPHAGEPETGADEWNLRREWIGSRPRCTSDLPAHRIFPPDAPQAFPLHGAPGAGNKTWTIAEHRAAERRCRERNGVHGSVQVQLGQ